MTDERTYIWISRWEDFQHYRLERGKSQAWIKTYTRQLFDDDYLSLTEGERLLLHELRLLHAQHRLSTRSDPRRLAQALGHRVLSRQLESLNRAGYIEFISRETLDNRLEKLYRKSSPEVEVEVDNPPTPLSRKNGKAKHVCTRCANLEFTTADKLADHLYIVHDQEAA